MIHSAISFACSFALCHGFSFLFFSFLLFLLFLLFSFAETTNLETCAFFFDMPRKKRGAAARARAASSRAKAALSMSVLYAFG